MLLLVFMGIKYWFINRHHKTKQRMNAMARLRSFVRVIESKNHIYKSSEGYMWSRRGRIPDAIEFKVHGQTNQNQVDGKRSDLCPGALNAQADSRYRDERIQNPGVGSLWSARLEK